MKNVTNKGFRKKGRLDNQIQYIRDLEITRILTERFIKEKGLLDELKEYLLKPIE